MTTHTPSPAQEAAIQEGERIAAADEYFSARTWIMDTNDNRRIFEAGFDRAYALLSKLRAPVANELQPSGNAGELPDAVRVPLDSLHADAGYLVGRALDHSLSRAEVVAVIRSRIDAAKAALASAPVAGEAITDAMTQAGAKAAREYFEQTGGNSPAVIYKAMRAAAPQASEAVRDALQKLVDMYVLNQGSDHEHITCYTPLPASHLTPKQRAKSETWKAWDDARAALSAQPGAQRTGGSE